MLSTVFVSILYHKVRNIICVFSCCRIVVWYFYISLAHLVMLGCASHILINASSQLLLKKGSLLPTYLWRFSTVYLPCGKSKFNIIYCKVLINGNSLLLLFTVGTGFHLSRSCLVGLCYMDLPYGHLL